MNRWRRTTQFSATRKMLVSFGVLLLLILTKARNDQQQFNRPYGNDLSPNHPDYFSKSLHGRRNSIVYGIRPTDGTMAIFNIVDQIHDPEKVTALINASSSTNRFTFSQVYLVYRQGVIFMLLMTEEKVNRTTLTTVYNVKEFHRFIHPNSNRFTFSYDDYNSSLVELTRFEEETGARHVFRPVMQYYQNVTKFHGILDFNTEKRFSKLFMIQGELRLHTAELWSQRQCEEIWATYDSAKHQLNNHISRLPTSS